MAVCWLPAIYLLTYSVFAARALFHECDTRRIWIEEYDDPEFTCMVDITATVRWFLTSTTGSTRDLGTCEMPYNCTSTYSSSELSLTRNGTESLAKFYSLHRKFDGELLCQETLSNGTLVSDTCPLKVGRATFRQTHYSDLLEDRGSNMFCYCYDYAPSTISWTLITHSGQTLDLGNCTDVNVCTSLQAPNVTLERLAIYPSFASFDNTDRSLGGQVRCSYTYNGSTDTDELLLNLYYPARLSNCHAEVSQHNWSTVLVCDINNVLSSSGAYDFTVFEKFQILKDTELTPANRFIFEGRLPYGNILEPYTDSAKNKVYYRGRLFYSWPLSPVQGLYTRLELYVYFGHSANRREYIPYNFNVTTPNNPTHNCSELTFIPETGEVPCVCTALSLGSPAGRLLWLLGNLTIATGGYGVNQLKFPSGLVNRQHDGMMMRCQLDWVLPKSTAPIRHVAYGPESLTLQINQSVDATNNTEVHVISHVTGMKPMMSEMVLWGGVCQGHQGFTCTLTPRSAAEVDGKAVTCRVTNTANNGLSAEASAIVRLSREFNEVYENFTQGCEVPARQLGEACGRGNWTSGYCAVRDSVCTGNTDLRICMCGKGTVTVNDSNCEKLPGELFASETETIQLQSNTNISETVFTTSLSTVAGANFKKKIVVLPTNDWLGIDDGKDNSGTFSIYLTKRLPEANEVKSFTIVATVTYVNDSITIKDTMQLNINITRVFQSPPPVRGAFLVDGTRRGAIVFDLLSELDNVAGLDLGLDIDSRNYSFTLSNSHLIICETDVLLSDFASSGVLGKTLTLNVTGSSQVILTLKVAVISNRFQRELSENKSPDFRVVDYSELSSDFDVTECEDSSDTIFSLNKTGNYVHFTQAPDYENVDQRNLIFCLKVTFDTNVATTIPVEVSVTDVDDEAPKRVEPHPDLISIPRLPRSVEQGRIIGLLRFTDSDTRRENLWYTIEGSNSEYFQEIDPLDGALILKQGLPPDTGNFTIQVTARDGKQRSSTSNVTIEVYDIYEAPELEVVGETVEVNLSENVDGGFYVANLTQANYTGYRLQPPSKYFSVDPETGVVTTTNVTIDRENLIQNPLTIFAIAYPEGSTCNFYVVGNVTITITDVNDNKPEPSQTAYTAPIDEHSPVGSSVFTVSADDADIGENAELRFSLTGPDSRIFNIDKVNGTITVADSTLLDRETKETLLLNVTITDGGDSITAIRNTAYTLVTVMLQDINDNDPEFTGNSCNDSFVENRAYSKPLCTINAIDVDVNENGRIRYSLSRDFGYFALDSSTGELSLTRALDRELDNHYTLTIIAFDEGSPPRSADVDLNITVEDVNDGAPHFQDSYVNLKLDETSVCNSTAILTVTADDQDTGRNAEITYSIDSALLWIDNRTGEIYCIPSGLDYEKVTHRELTAVVTATDGGTPALSSTATVHLSLNDVNDNPPKFQQSSYYFATENKDSRVVGIVRAVDSDSGDNGKLNYTITSSTTTPAVVSVSADGILRLTQANRPPQVYSMTLTATDNGVPPLSSSATVTVNVTEADSEAKDLLTAAEFYFAVEENTTHSETKLGRLTVTEQNSSYKVDFQLENVIPPEYESFFDVDNATGEVLANGSLDRENLGEQLPDFTFILYVKASAAKTNSSVDRDVEFAAVRIQLLDVNDHEPQFILDNIDRTEEVVENAANGTLVITLSATDPDNGDNGTVIYSLNDTEVFQIDQDGRITVARSQNLDRESTDTYVLLVTVRDNATIPASSTATLTISVTDVNDNAPIFDPNGTYSFNVSEADSPNTVVGTVRARDPDLFAYGLQEFVVLNPDQCPCSVENAGDEMTGSLKLRELDQPLDYDEGEREFTCVIRAVDKGDLSSEQNITISLTDANDNRPVFGHFEREVNVSRDVEVDTVLVTVTATDLDSGRNGDLVYELPSDSEQSYFAIDHLNGTVKLANSLRDVPSDTIVLNVTVRDRGDPPHADSTEITIRISDNNTKPVLNQSEYRLRIMEERNITGTLLSVSATDYESGNPAQCNCTFSISESGDSGARFTDYFHIDPKSGGVGLTKPIDRERTGSHIVGHIVVTDTGIPPKSSSALVNVTVLDVNDNLPTFPPPREDSFTITVNPREQNQPECQPGRMIHTLNAFDADEPPHNAFEYAINTMSQILTAWKYVDLRAGQLFLNSSDLCACEDECTTTYGLEVGVYESGSSTPQASGTFKLGITVHRINGAPNFSQPLYEVSLPSNSAVGTRLDVPAFEATDEDNDTLTYSLVSGNQRHPFKVGNQTGTLTLAYPLDENVEFYTLTIIVSDEGSVGVHESFAKTATATVNVTVTDDPVTATDQPPCVRQSEVERLQEQADQFALYRTLFIVLVVLLVIAVVAAVLFLYKWRAKTADYRMERRPSVAHNLFRPPAPGSAEEKTGASESRSADTTGLPPRLPRRGPDQRRVPTGDTESPHQSGQSGPLATDDAGYLAPSDTAGRFSDQNISWTPHPTQRQSAAHDYIPVLSDEAPAPTSSNPYSPLERDRSSQPNPYLQAGPSGEGTPGPRTSATYLHPTTPTHPARAPDHGTYLRPSASPTGGILPPPPSPHRSSDMPSPYTPGDPAVYRARRSPSINSLESGTSSGWNTIGPIFRDNVATPYGLRPVGGDPTGFTQADRSSRI